MGILRVPRATTAERMSLTPDTGEVIFDTDLENYWGGDSVTVGGIPFGSTANIPEYNTDPVSPADGDAWVLRSGSGSGGLAHSIVTLGLTLAGSGAFTYQFSYKTISSGIKRVTLT